jgi:hypothetical protein
MEFQLSKLKKNFSNIKGIRNNTKNIFDILEVKINKLKNTHAELIKNNQTQIFIFGLDSFHFQSKLIDIEYDEMKRLFLAINNRMYCEYFKLYKLIVDYILQNITDKKITEIIKLNNFPIYKDLEPFKEYKFEFIMEIHENIIILISGIISNISKKEIDLQNYKSKKELGLSLDNFVNSFNFDIIIMREKVKLFLMYIDFFHKLHTKYLKRFSNKIQLMYTNIINDIRFDDSMSIDSKNKEQNYEIDNENLYNEKDIKIELDSTIKKHNLSSSSSESDISHFNINDQNITPKSSDTIIKTKSVEEVINIINNNKNIKNIREIEKSISDEDISIVLKNIEETCEQMIYNNTLDNTEETLINKNKLNPIIEENIIETETETDKNINSDSKDYLSDNEENNNDSIITDIHTDIHTDINTDIHVDNDGTNKKKKRGRKKKSH